MHYFALLLSPELTAAPDPDVLAAEMAAYGNFHASAGHAIRAGDALAPTADGARIAGGPDKPVVTDGPFAEGAEVAGGYYVFEAENLDDALALAAQIPVAHYGAIEIWPVVEWSAPQEPVADDWLALLLEPPGDAITPDSEEWESCTQLHAEFGRAVGDHILAGAALHPPTTATTVRVRNGQVGLTDGPFAESAEVASGVYLLRAADRDEAVKIASMIPAAAVQLRRLAGISGL